ALTLLSAFNPQHLNREHQLGQRYLQGWAYYKLNHLQEAEYRLGEAEPIAKELKKVYFQLRIINLLANIYAAMRNYTQAIQAHQRCLILLEDQQEERDPFFTVRVYTHLGQHNLHTDNIEQALEAFHKALTLADTLTTSEDSQTVYARLCRYYATIKEEQ